MIIVWTHSELSMVHRSLAMNSLTCKSVFRNKRMRKTALTLLHSLVFSELKQLSVSPTMGANNLLLIFLGIVYHLLYPSGQLL